MVKTLSRIAIAAALIAAAGSSHSYIRLGIAQGATEFVCRSDTFAGCGVLAGSVTVLGVTTLTYDASGGLPGGDQIFTIRKQAGVEDVIRFTGTVGDYFVT